MKRLVSFSVLLALILIMTNTSFGQVLDGAFARETTVKRNVVPLPYLREADAMYSKKILRRLELKEKQNLPLYFPLSRMTYPGELQPQRSRISLLNLVFEIGILGKTFDKATGYNETVINDNRYPVFKTDMYDMTCWWKTPIERDDPLRDSLLAYTELIDVTDYDEDGLEITRKEATKSQLDPTNIGVMDEIWMWEEWFFDKQRSVMDVRILAMSFDGWVSPDARVWTFWIAYNDYRPLFTTYESFNSHNEAEHRTFDDIFLQRRFSSYIVAETNNYNNRLIEDYLVGIEAIREGERIQNDLFLMEHDMWEY